MKERYSYSFVGKGRRIESFLIIFGRHGVTLTASKDTYTLKHICRIKKNQHKNIYWRYNNVFVWGLQSTRVHHWYLLHLGTNSETCKCFVLLRLLLLNKKKWLTSSMRCSIIISSVAASIEIMNKTYVRFYFDDVRRREQCFFSFYLGEQVFV